MLQETERRRVQRVRPLQPLRGSVDTQKVFVLDLSVRGIRIAHQEPIHTAADACVLTFEWEGMRITLRCRVTRTDVQRAGNGGARALMHSGLEIISASPEAKATLRHLVEEHVLRAIDEQKANARGVPAIAAQSFQTGKGEQYVRHLFNNGKWTTTPTTDTRQPLNGFTISAEQTPTEIHMLRTAYESGDSAARDMIRKMAELSISRSEGIPTRRYMP